MEKDKVRIGITHGDANGIGYEVILKTFAEQEMLDMCVPVVYGSPKVAAYHRKALGLSTNFSIIDSAEDAVAGRLNMVNCLDGEIKVDFGKSSPEAGKAAFEALRRVTEDYRLGLVDAIVTAPINKQSIHSDDFRFSGHTEYLEQELGEGRKALMILLKDNLRVALATTHLPVSQISSALTKELIEEKLDILHKSLKTDFGIGAPRIAVLSLNPHAGDNGLLGDEEQTVIIPALKEMGAKGMLCYGPYPADGFMGSGNYRHFDAILAMYHDQGLSPFKVLSQGEGVNFTAGLPVVRTSPAHGTAYDIAGKGMACEDSFRQAVYLAMDVFRRREREAMLKAHALKPQKMAKYEGEDEKLNLEAEEDDV